METPEGQFAADDFDIVVYPFMQTGQAQKQVCIPKGSSFLRERIRTARFTEYYGTTSLYSTAARGGSFVEVGANIGSDTVLASDFFQKGYAFEPVSANFRMLRKTIELNGITNVQLFPLAVSDHCGKQRLFLGPVNSLDSSSLLPNRPEMTQSEEVDVVTLDTALPQTICDVTFLHIDTEGEDMKVLQGARQFLARQTLKPIIKMEFQPYSLTLHGSGIGQLIDFIDEHDYRVHFFANDHIVPLSPGILQNMFYLWRSTKGWIDIYLAPPISAKK